MVADLFVCFFKCQCSVLKDVLLPYVGATSANGWMPLMHGGICYALHQCRWSGKGREGRKGRVGKKLDRFCFKGRTWCILLQQLMVLSWFSWSNWPLQTDPRKITDTGPRRPVGDQGAYDKVKSILSLSGCLGNPLSPLHETHMLLAKLHAINFWGGDRTGLPRLRHD